MTKVQMKDLKRHWGWVLGMGIVLLILGGLGLGMSVSLTLVSMLFFSAFLVIAGIFHIIDVVKHKGWEGKIWQAFLGVLYLLAGGIVFYDPFLASTFITTMLAMVLLAMGILRLSMALMVRDLQGRGWVLLAGITAIILGALIILQWPTSGLWVIGMFIAIEMIVAGWTYICIALALRRM